MNLTLARNPIALAIAAIFMVVVLSAVFAIVPETAQVVVVRLNNPIKVFNGYKPKQDYGATGAGLIARWPFIDQLVWVDKRVLDIDMPQQSVLSVDQQRLEVDAFARYRVVDPVRMYLAARGDEKRVSDALSPQLGTALRNELGKQPFSALLSPERGQVMDNIQAGLNRVAAQYGVEIVDVRIKRADLPDGTPLQSAFARMKSARDQEAQSIRAEGGKEAAIIRAQADADASRTYADSFNRDPAFYDFYRAMQSYRHTFGTDGTKATGSANIILPYDNEYLRQFRGRKN